jgi:hypothetical protein
MLGDTTQYRRTRFLDRTQGTSSAVLPGLQHQALVFARRPACGRFQRHGRAPRCRHSRPQLHCRRDGWLARRHALTVSVPLGRDRPWRGRSLLASPCHEPFPVDRPWRRAPLKVDVGLRHAHRGEALARLGADCRRPDVSGRPDADHGAARRAHQVAVTARGRRERPDEGLDDPARCRSRIQCPVSCVYVGTEARGTVPTCTSASPRRSRCRCSPSRPHPTRSCV